MGINSRCRRVGKYIGTSINTITPFRSSLRATDSSIGIYSHKQINAYANLNIIRLIMLQCIAHYRLTVASLSRSVAKMMPSSTFGMLRPRT